MDTSSSVSGDGPVFTFEFGFPEVAAAKTNHFEQRSGERRSPDDLRNISDATYRVRKTYNDAEALFQEWAEAPIPADHAARYIRVGMGLDEAVEVWESRFATDPTGTAAALDTLIGLLPRN